MDNNPNDPLAAKEASNRLIFRILLIVVGFGILVLAGIGIRYALVMRTFRVVSISPTTNRVPVFTPYFEVNFSRDLASAELTVSSNPRVTVSHKADGKKLTIKLISPDVVMDNGKKYTITIKHITSTKGEKLGDQTFSFKPNENLTSDVLPKSIQDYLMARQSKKPTQADDVVVQGLDELTTQGLSDDQFVNLQQALFGFTPKATSSTIDTKSVQASQVVADDGTAKFFLSFTIKIDGKTYFAKLDTTDVSAVQLLLYNNARDTNQPPVYDSGLVDVVNGDIGD